MSLPPLFRPNFVDDINSPDDTTKTSQVEDHKSDHSADSKGSGVDVGLDLNDISDDDEDVEDEESDGEHDLEASKPYNRFLMDICMKVFVYGMIAVTWYLIVFYLNMPLKEGFMGKQGSEFLISVLSFMAMFSYFKCSSDKSDNQKHKPPPFLGNIEQKSCEPCQKWKPERAHHCRWCQKCILRMDHHCPWICNCVGYRNHKAFLLFCFYIGIGSLYFNYRAIKFFFWMPTPQESLALDYSVAFIVFCVFCGFTICPVGIMAFGLSIYHFLLAMSNLTTLEHYKGGKIQLPCSFGKPKKMNKYDNGKLANLADFFGNTYLFWWWPTIATYSYKGQRYVRLNEPSQREIDNFVDSSKKGDAASENIKDKPKSLKEVDVGDFLRIAEEYVKGKGLQFNDVKLENPTK